MSANYDLGGDIMEKVNEALKKRGNATIIIAGKTGVGKSTLINAIFQGNMAKTGVGRPVTDHLKEISKEGIPTTIIDTRGIEIKAHKETRKEIINLIKSRNKSDDPNKHIHIAWMCIQEGTPRVEDAEIDLANIMADYIPVVNVITRAKSDQGFKEEVERYLSRSVNTVRVRALRECFDDGHVLETMGLVDLMEVTTEALPKSQRNAFVAAQKVSIKKKVERAHGVVAASAASAIGVGIAPIPFSDAVLLAPIQVGMLAGISAVFGLSLDKVFLNTLVSGAISAMGGTFGGRALVTGLLKLIPGANVLGSAIAGATAGLLTTTFGETYIAVLKNVVKEKGLEDVTADEIASLFSTSIAKKVKKK